MYMHNWEGSYYHAWGPAGQMGSFGPEGWMLAALALAAPFIIVALLWSLTWKGLGLWHSARRGQYWWFLAMLVFNTLGILEIVYLFFVAKIAFKDLFTLKGEHAHHAHHTHS